ncbi:MAG: hypothetical protein WC889_08150 [Myxococcota bacterium]|jgi:hypothetical protein
MNYRERFEAARVPDAGEFSGRYAVSLSVPLMKRIRFFGHFKSFPDGDGDRGFNCFLGLIRIGAFRLERGASTMPDGLEVMKIIYDDRSNPLPLRMLTDEVREERPGFCFCRGVVDILGKPVVVMYFTLEKLEG